MEEMSVVEEKIRKREEEDLYNPLMGGTSPRRPPRASVISTCYSCRYYNPGLPTACSHPCGFRVQWDMVRQQSYRVPSQVMTSEHRGMCPYFLADPMRSVEFLMKEEETRALLEMIAMEAEKSDLDLQYILLDLQSGIYQQLKRIEEFTDNSDDEVEEWDEEEEWDPSLLVRLIEKLRNWRRNEEYEEEYDEE